MKKTTLILIIILTILPLGAKSNEPHDIDWLNLSFTSLPSEFLYPSYLADPLAVNTQITYRQYQIDEIHPESTGEEGHFDITIGTRFNFWRISPKDNPNIGIEMDWGLAISTFMNSDGTDLLGMDGIYYFALAIRPVDWAAIRLSRHHICAHQGDQLDTNGDGSPYIDFDPNIYSNESNYIRDDYMISAYFEPLHFLEPILPTFSKTLRVYGDYNFYVPGYDLLGRRTNDPTYHSYNWYQYGVELEIPIENHEMGSFFVAAQQSHWQQTSYAANLNVELGIIFPTGKDGQRMKLAYQYYDGQSLLNNYQTKRAKFSGFAFTID
jgi:hypothetical protein